LLQIRMQVDLRQGVVAASDVADAVGDAVASDPEDVVAAGAGGSVEVGRDSVEPFKPIGGES
jgi:hypothetical protein